MARYRMSGIFTIEVDAESEREARIKALEMIEREGQHKIISCESYGRDTPWRKEGTT